MYNITQLDTNIGTTIIANCSICTISPNLVPILGPPLLQAFNITSTTYPWVHRVAVLVIIPWLCWGYSYSELVLIMRLAVLKWLRDHLWWAHELFRLNFVVLVIGSLGCLFRFCSTLFKMVVGWFFFWSFFYLWIQFVVKLEFWL